MEKMVNITNNFQELSYGQVPMLDIKLYTKDPSGDSDN